MTTYEEMAKMTYKDKLVWTIKEIEKMLKGYEELQDPKLEEMHKKYKKLHKQKIRELAKLEK